jgi:nucleoporin POM34
LSDIPLTAAQRKLLNLPPTPVAATPEAISTPPRYSRTPSISGSVGSRASYTSSPLSGRGSPIVGGNLGGSPYSPLGSPLAPKSFTPVINSNRKPSLGSPVALGASTATSLFPEPATPSPNAGKRTSVGLNSKWLYEKGRRSSGGNWQY